MNIYTIPLSITYGIEKMIYAVITYGIECWQDASLSNVLHQKLLSQQTVEEVIFDICN